MIEVSELAEASEPRTAEELQEILLGHLGKFVRIRQAADGQVLVDSGDGRGSYYAVAVECRDISARLLSVDLKLYRSSAMSFIDGGALSVTQEGDSQSKHLDLKSAELQIQVLQEGRGWLIVHQSKGWSALMEQESTGEAQ